MRGNPELSVALAVLLSLSLTVLVNLPEEASAYTVRGRITIDGNSNFISQYGVVSGSGTWNDPFIIEGWEINASGGVGIKIKNSDAHFVIRNVLVHSGASIDYHGEDGISLSLVENGVIENVTLQDNADGIGIGGSANVTVRYSDIYSNNHYGIYLSSTTNVTIANTSIFDNNRDGIYAHRSESASIAGCLISENEGYGVSMTNSTNGSIAGNDIAGNQWGGIELIESDRNTIVHNSISGDRYGVTLRQSKRSSLSNNTMLGNGIHIWGDSPEYWTTHTIDETNVANGKPIIYRKNSVGGEIPPGIAQAILVNCSSMTVENQNVSNVTTGILLGYSTEIGILNNSAFGNVYGLYVHNSSGITISDNEMSENWNGIQIHGTNNMVTRNTLHRNAHHGIVLGDSENNTISANSLWNNTLGLLVGGSSIDNSIYHNSFNNPSQAKDTAGNNRWDMGYPLGGNYWSDHFSVNENQGPDQNQPGVDGIWDAPYQAIIGDAAHDQYPLAAPLVFVRNDPPKCAITYPQLVERVSGVFSFGGEAFDWDGSIARVDVRIDDGPWIPMTDTRYWMYDWDTTNVSNGEHTVQARSYDGTDHSEVAGLTLIVDNRFDSEHILEQPWFWAVIAIIIVVMLVLLIFLWRRKLKKNESPPSS